MAGMGHGRHKGAPREEASNLANNTDGCPDQLQLPPEGDGELLESSLSMTSQGLPWEWGNGERKSVHEGPQL